MVTSPRVVEDERDPVEAVQRSQPRWVWLLVGLLLGVGGSVVVLGMNPPAQSPATTSPAAARDPTLGGIADTIEGFPDGLLAVTRGDGQSLELMLWPLRGEPYQRTIPVGAARPPGPVDFDQSGRRIATLIPVAEEPYGVLYAGVPENAAVVATDVIGYAWHDSEPFRLAFTTFTDGELLLWTLTPEAAEPHLMTRAVGIEGPVAAWGDWGFAVQDEATDQIVLFTDVGEIKAHHPGSALASYPTGWITVVAGEEVTLLSSGGGVRGLDREGLQGDILAAGFSPDGEKLALLSRDHVLVLALDDDSELLESGGRAGVTQITWSSDGRFVLYPGRRGIWAVDTENGNVRQLLTTRTFTGLGIAELSSS